MTSEAAAPDDDLDDRPVSLGERLRRILAVPGRLLAALFMPDRGMPAAVHAGRYGAALVTVMLCGLVAAASIGVRLDVSTDILAQAARAHTEQQGGGGGGGPPPGETGPGAQAAQTKSDREITEDIAKTLAVARVSRALDAGLWTPLCLLVLAVVVYGMLRYVGGTPTIGRSLAAATHAALPYAVKCLVIAVAASLQPALTPAQADGLVGNALAPAYASLGPTAVALLGGFDPFMIWSLVLLGFGMAPAGEISRTRAFITLVVGLALYTGLGVISNAACGGSGGPPGSPPPG
jgi:hypothetical protein